MSEESSVHSSKKELRSYFKSLLQAKLSPQNSDSQNLQNKIVQNVSLFLTEQVLNKETAFGSTIADEESVYWGTYKALPFEASAEVESAGLKKRLKWVYPRMTQGRLEFIAPTQWQQDARFGVVEPSQGELIPLEKIHGLFIPALAFDRDGNRLGRGKGFYDQTLENFRGLRVGIGFSWQISHETIPHEAHDVRMNWLITESEHIKCR